MDSINIDEEKVELTISLIDAISKENEESILLAQQSFDDLNQHEKKEVTNYTKLFYFTANNPEYVEIDLKNIPITLEVESEYLGKAFIVNSLSDVENQMNKIDFSASNLYSVNPSIFENKTVVATIEPANWYFISNEEIFSYKLYPLGILLVFYKEKPYALLDAVHYCVRLIILDTIYPLDFLDSFQVLFTTDVIA
jgi:hypothetical protein